MSVLNEYFDKIYCINLDRREDRWEECKVIFERMGLEVERFSAFDGKGLDSGFGKVYNAELAGSISHTRVLKAIKDDKTLSKVLILEDDIEFCEGFEEKFSKCVKDLPEDWALFFFGGNHTGGKNPVSENISQVYRTLALHAYGVNQKYVDYIYQNMIQFIGYSLAVNKKLEPSVAADFWMAKVQTHVDCYTTTPNLTWQREGYSDLQHDFMDYDFLK